MAIELKDRIEFVKTQVKAIFTGNHLNELRYKFITQSISPYTNYDVQVTGIVIFSWGDNDIIKELTGEYDTHNFQSIFEVVCKLLFKDSTSTNSQEIEHKFKLTCDGVISITGNSIGFIILDEQSLLLKKYDELVKINIAKTGTPTLWEDRKNFRGKNGVSLFTDVINKRNTSLSISINAFDKFDDLARCLSDIRYTIGELITIRPYTTNYLGDKMDWNGNIIYRHFPSFHDKQYWLKAGIVFQLLYNYWDKIGDILAIYFTPLLPEKQIYFGMVIENIPNQILNSTYNKIVNTDNIVVHLDNVFNISHYQWLKSFKETNFKVLNKKRIKIVHYTNIESEYFQQYAKSNTNADELSRLQKEKEDLVDLFLSEHKNGLKGFEEMLLLIDQLP